jgi:hypothetical protein
MSFVRRLQTRHRPAPLYCSQSRTNIASPIVSLTNRPPPEKNHESICRSIEDTHVKMKNCPSGYSMLSELAKPPTRVWRPANGPIRGQCTTLARFLNQDGCLPQHQDGDIHESTRAHRTIERRTTPNACRTARVQLKHSHPIENYLQRDSAASEHARDWMVGGKRDMAIS